VLVGSVASASQCRFSSQRSHLERVNYSTCRKSVSFQHRFWLEWSGVRCCHPAVTCARATRFIRCGQARCRLESDGCNLQFDGVSFTNDRSVFRRTTGKDSFFKRRKTSEKCERTFMRCWQTGLTTGLRFALCHAHTLSTWVLVPAAERK